MGNQLFVKLMVMEVEVEDVVGLPPQEQNKVEKSKSENKIILDGRLLMFQLLGPVLAGRCFSQPNLHSL
jgi:hypothetical protein